MADRKAGFSSRMSSPVRQVQHDAGFSTWPISPINISSYILYPPSQLGHCPESPRHGPHTALHTARLFPSIGPPSPWSRPLSWHGVSGACWAWAPPELLEQRAGGLLHPALVPSPCFCVCWSLRPQLSESRPTAHQSHYIHVLCVCHSAEPPVSCPGWRSLSSCLFYEAKDSIWKRQVLIDSGGTSCWAQDSCSRDRAENTVGAQCVLVSREATAAVL